MTPDHQMQWWQCRLCPAPHPAAPQCDRVDHQQHYCHTQRAGLGQGTSHTLVCGCDMHSSEWVAIWRMEYTTRIVWCHIPGCHWLPLQCSCLLLPGWKASLVGRTERGQSSVSRVDLYKGIKSRKSKGYTWGRLVVTMYGFPMASYQYVVISDNISTEMKSYS